jgi:hypothetical protein
MLSDFLSVPSTVSETRAYLDEWIDESSRALEAEAPCWADSTELVKADAPDHFAAGPGWRPESKLDLWFFRPGFVYRADTSTLCDRSDDATESWAYVRSHSGLPFFVRTHFGYFSEPHGTENGDTSKEGPPGTANEGVRTYFTFFGKTLLLNEWSTQQSSE